MDGFSMPGGSNGNIIHDICLCDRDTKEVFQEDIGFIYVELENFIKTEEEAGKSSGLDKWLYVLKNMSEMEALPVYLRRTVFEKVFEIAKYSNLSKEEKEMYNASVKRKWDEQSRWETAINEGMEKGLLLGMERGMERGIEQERSRAQGERLSIALNLKRMGLTKEEISNAVGLKIEGIESL